MTKKNKRRWKEEMRKKQEEENSEAEVNDEMKAKK
jgi:hypothetical protein